MKRKMEGEKEGMSGAWREKKKKKRKGRKTNLAAESNKII
jgi:hypothetical protein